MKYRFLSALSIYSWSGSPPAQIPFCYSNKMTTVRSRQRLRAALCLFLKFSFLFPVMDRILSTIVSIIMLKLILLSSYSAALTHSEARYNGTLTIQSCSLYLPLDTSHLTIKALSGFDVLKVSKVIFEKGDNPLFFKIRIFKGFVKT